MTRLCGTMSWLPAPGDTPDRWRGPDRWRWMVQLLGPGAVEHAPAPPAGGPGVTLAVWSPGGGGPSPAGLASDGAISVAFAGYLRDLPPGAGGEAEFVLARYRARDWSWLKGANGVFGFAVVDAAARRCVLGVDRLGLRPLLYACSRDGIAFGSDLAVVAASLDGRPAPDHDVLQEMLGVGFPLSNRTALRGVERVPPGSTIEVTPAGPRVLPYWSFADLPPVRPQTLETFLDESQERLRHVLDRLFVRCADQAVCWLSSGYDSRRLLLESHAVGRRPLTVTAALEDRPGAGTTLEPAVTLELCRRLGLRNRLVMAPGVAAGIGMASARWLRNVLLDFQAIGPYHAWAIPLIAAVPASPAAWGLDGIAGDVLFGRPFPIVPRDVWGRWEPEPRVVDAIAPDRRRLDRAWDGLISASLGARIEAHLRSLPEGPYRLTFFHLLGRTRRMIALWSHGLMDLRVESFCPYLDNDVVEHALTMDAMEKATVELQRSALMRHFPAFWDIPSSHTPAGAVPARYLTPLPFVDPEYIGRIRVADALRVARTLGGSTRWPRTGARDVAYAWLSASGLGRLVGGWREPRLRDLLDVLRGVDLLVHAGPDAVLASRTAAWQRLDAPGTFTARDRP